MGWWSRLYRTIRGAETEREVEEELRFHLEMEEAAGSDRPQAYMRLGNLGRITEEARSVSVFQWLETMLQDLRYAFRQLTGNRALALAIVLSVGTGIGANTAIFALVDAALLKPLPVSDPNSLRIIEWTHSGFPEGVQNINGSFSRKAEGQAQGSSVSAHLYHRLAGEQSAFTALIGIADPNAAAIVVDNTPAAQISLQYVGANFFQALGVRPVVGRAFLADEDRTGAEPAVIISHRFWLERMAASPDAIQQSVRINYVLARVVGVAPPGFFGMRAGQWTDVYAPLSARVAFSGARGENDADWWVRQVGRLKASANEQESVARFANEFRKIAVAEGMKPGQVPQMITLPGRRGFQSLNARDSSALWILLLLVGVLLLLVCTNVANLLLSRSVSRRRESAVRMALGAGRARLLQQYLTECAVLSLLGGTAGLVLGYVLSGALHALFQSGREPGNAFALGPDWRIFGYTATLSLLAAVLFGLAPAMRSASANLNESLKAQSRSFAGGKLRLPRILVAIQMALCLIALVSAGMLGRSLRSLQWIDLGFDRENLFYLSVNPRQAGYGEDRMTAYVERLRGELAAMPGVAGLGVTQIRLLSGNGNISRANIPGRAIQWEKGVVGESAAVSLNSVGEGFFETMRIPFLAGRDFASRDLRAGSDAVIVDELFVRRFFAGRSAVGQRFGLTVQNNHQFQIVGVVRNTRYNSLREAPLPAIYHPYRPGSVAGPVHFAIRSALPGTILAESARKMGAAIDPAVPVTEFHTQDGLIDRLLRTERLLGFVSGGFGLIALVIAAIGIAGVLAYTVARRRNEIGVRVALGAARGDIARMVLRDCLLMLAMGTLAGLPGAWAVSLVLRSMLFQTEPADPATIAVSFLVLLMIALLAAWIPARRAAKIDPMLALRQD